MDDTSDNQVVYSDYCDVKCNATCTNNCTYCGSSEGAFANKYMISISTTLAPIPIITKIVNHPTKNATIKSTTSTTIPTTTSFTSTTVPTTTSSTSTTVPTTSSSTSTAVPTTTTTNQPTVAPTSNYSFLFCSKPVPSNARYEECQSCRRATTKKMNALL